MQRDSNRLKRTRGQPRPAVRTEAPLIVRAVAGENPKGGTGPKPEQEARAGGPERTCVGCRLHAAKGSMVRIVAAEDGCLALDPKARAGGRGAWVHTRRRCIDQAVKRHAAERTLKVSAQAGLSAAGLLSDLAEGLVRRVTSLMVVASRTRSLSVGTDAVEDSLGRKGPMARLVLVATDAGESAKRLASWARASEGLESAEGAQRPGAKVVSYGTKSELGRVFGRDEIALLAITDARIATELAATIERLSGLEDRS